MTTPTPEPRWYRLTPDRLIPALLVVEGLLWLSERFRWFGFNEHRGFTVLIALASVGAAMLLMFLWFAASLLFRWRFQFSIRSLLLLVPVVAIACSWMTVEMKSARQQKEAVEALEKLRAMVEYDDCQVRRLGHPPPSACSSGEAWLQDLLGEDFFATAVGVRSFPLSFTDAALQHLKGLTRLQDLDLAGAQVTDAGLERLKGLTQLQTISLWDTHVTDAGLEHLKGLTQLQELDLRKTPVTDAGLEHLKGLTKLQELGLGETQVSDAGLEHLKGLTQLQALNLWGTRVTDAGLEHLKGLTHLQTLSLWGTHVTDAGLEHLKGLKQLQDLCLAGTKVTDEGVRKLQKALPKCKISHDF